MALKPTQIQQIKNYLGYGNLTVLALPYIDVALVFETVVQSNTDAFAEEILNDLLPKVAQVEQDIFDARKKYVVTEVVGEVKIDPEYHRKLLTTREWLIDRIAETIKIPRAPQLKRSSACEVY